jgi:hypothetical protein
MIEAQQIYSASTVKGKAFQFVHCCLKVRHCEKFILLHEAMNQAKRPSESLTPSEGDEGGHGTTPTSSVPPTKRDRTPGRKQARSREGGDEYMEVWSSFLQMKTEEHMQREARWNRNNLLEERKLQIEEKQLLWEQEQKIMFCDVSKLDGAQRNYVLAMRSHIVKEKVSLLSSGGSSARDGDGESCA